MKYQSENVIYQLCIIGNFPIQKIKGILDDVPKMSTELNINLVWNAIGQNNVKCEIFQNINFSCERNRMVIATNDIKKISFIVQLLKNILTEGYDTFSINMLELATQIVFIPKEKDGAKKTDSYFCTMSSIVKNLFNNPIMSEIVLADDPIMNVSPQRFFNIKKIKSITVEDDKTKENYVVPKMSIMLINRWKKLSYANFIGYLDGVLSNVDKDYESCIHVLTAI